MPHESLLKHVFTDEEILDALGTRLINLNGNIANQRVASVIRRVEGGIEIEILRYAP